MSAEENGQDGMYAEDRCRCGDPLRLYFCHVHEHWSSECDCKTERERRRKDRNR